MAETSTRRSKVIGTLLVIVPATPLTAEVGPI